MEDVFTGHETSRSLPDCAADHRSRLAQTLRQFGHRYWGLPFDALPDRRPFFPCIASSTILRAAQLTGGEGDAGRITTSLLARSHSSATTVPSPS
jgi:hypothetical protein